MRLNQYISTATGLSRRAADTEISSGHVTIDGRIAVLGEQVEDQSVVALNGQAIKPTAVSTYIMLNKPVGYVSSRAKQGTDPTVYELLPARFSSLKPAGRLDKDSRGLMLLSDDGQFIQRFTHPSSTKTKVYELTLDHPLSRSSLDHLQAGVELEDGPSFLSVISSSGVHATVSLLEGRNRQIRRTLGALGYSVTDLLRTEIGPFKLGSLASGAWLEIDPDTSK